MIPKLLYKSYFGHFFAQMRWFRKWHSGSWCKVIPRPFPYMWFWTVENEVNATIEKITHIENRD